MPFTRKIQIINDQFVRWEFGIEICGKEIPLAQSSEFAVGVHEGQAATTWPLLFGGKETTPVTDFDKLDKANDITFVVVEKLEELSQSPDLEKRVALSLLFQDRLLKDPGIRTLMNDLNIVRTKHGLEMANRGVVPADQVAVTLILCKAIYYFLRRDERYITLDATLAYLYAIWQWYNTAKYLSMTVRREYCEAKGQKSGNEMGSHEYIMMTREMAEAHHILAELLQSPPGFDEAIIWLADWRRIDTARINTSLLREQMRLSLPLIPTEWEKPSFSNQEIDCTIPFTAPCWQNPAPQPENMKGRLQSWLGRVPEPNPDWKTTVLHPVFRTENNKETTGRQAVRRMVADWLLSRYDISNAVQISRCLVEKPWNPRAFLTIAGAALIVFFAIFLLPTFFNLPETVLIAGVILQIGILGLLVVLVVKNVDRSTIPYLILPRVAGGVAVGYFVLILSEDSMKLQRFFVRDGMWMGWSVLLIFLLWAAVLVLGYLYLWHDAIPFVGVGRPDIAHRRAVQVLLIALADSVFMGLFFLAIASQMYLYDDLLKSDARHLLGPLGLIDCLTFFILVPFALLTGLVTQFIFEEKSVTTSVWAPEVE